MLFSFVRLYLPPELEFGKLLQNLTSPICDLFWTGYYESMCFRYKCLSLYSPRMTCWAKNYLNLGYFQQSSLVSSTKILELQSLKLFTQTRTQLQVKPEKSSQIKCYSTNIWDKHFFSKSIVWVRNMILSEISQVPVSVAVYDQMGTSKNILESNEISNISSVNHLILSCSPLLSHDYLWEICAVFSNARI